MKGINKVILFEEYKFCPDCGSATFHDDSCYVERLLNLLKEKEKENNGWMRKKLKTYSKK